MHGVGVPVRDTRDGIPDGAEKRNQEGGDGGFRVVSETQAAALDGMVSQEVGECRNVCGEVCDGFEEVCGGVMKSVGEGRAPGSERWCRGRIRWCVVEYIGKEEVVQSGESAEPEEGGNCLRVGQAFS